MSLHLAEIAACVATRGSFPTDEAALRLLFLVIRNTGLLAPSG